MQAEPVITVPLDKFSLKIFTNSFHEKIRLKGATMDATKILLGTRSNLDGRVIIVVVVVTMTIATLTTKMATRLGSQICSISRVLSF